MAKLKMKKIEIIALLTDSKKIVELLQRQGIIEICNCSDASLVKTNASAAISQFSKFRGTVQLALEIMNKYAPEKKSLADALSGKKELDKHTFGTEAQKLESSMLISAEIIQNSRNISEAEAELAQISVRKSSLAQWSELDIPMNFKGTSSASCFIGTIPKLMTQAELAQLLPDDAYAEILLSSKIQTNLCVVCTKTSEDTVCRELRKAGFSPLSEPSELTPAQLLAQLDDKEKNLSLHISDSVNKIKSLQNKRRLLEFMTDYLQMRKDKYEALNSLAFTENTFVLNGYIPEKYADSVIKEITSEFTASVSLCEPEPDDDVPVLLENSSFSEPVEGITEMYAMPGKKDVDPTPVMSFFYYLFFGMMLSDAGYGLIMIIGTAFVLKKFRLEKNLRRSLVMFRNCGVSTLVFGALFGSWFGDIVQVVGREFFGKEIGSLALWFEPIDDPIKLLLYSFALGIAHLFLGLAVSFKMQWDDGKKLDAILDKVPVFLTILGVCPIGASILTDVPSFLITSGKYAMITGVAALILTAGRSSQSLFGKIFGGLYALYNTATGYLGDILSYSRLLALGLATGSIAGVINLIGTMPENLVIKAVLLIIVFIFGHAANLAINLLGAYVHTDRLQFVELFSKFYEGGGRAFQPFEAKTNYIKFKEESIHE